MKTENGKVTLVVGEGDAKKEFTKDYQKVIFETAADIVGWLQDAEKAPSVIAALNYGYDLKQRAKVRQQLESTSAGPEKALEKLIKNIQAARTALGKPELPYEKALEKAKAMLAASDED